MKRDGIYRLLRSKILHKKVHVGIIGVGTIGELVATSISQSGFLTTGFDINLQKINEINKRKNILFRVTDDFSQLSLCEIIIICVPTPVTKNKKPDLTYLKKAIKSILVNAKNYHLVLLESSVNIGATRNILVQKLYKKTGITWFIGYSPERIDPGNTKYTLSNTPKIISGIDAESLQLTKLFYSLFITSLIQASSLEAAEATKLFENTFRLVNISLVHELSSFARLNGLDMWEIVNLAKTKPFGFLPHYPSSGIGGHCIPVDPYYLIDDARRINVRLPIVAESLKRNKKRYREISTLVEKHFDSQKNNKSILIIGISYKKNSSDTRESAALHIGHLLRKKGWDVLYYDPLVTLLEMKSISLTRNLIESVAVVLITTAHSVIDFSIFKNTQTPIIDTTHTLTYFHNKNIIHI